MAQKAGVSEKLSLFIRNFGDLPIVSIEVFMIIIHSRTPIYKTCEARLMPNGSCELSKGGKVPVLSHWIRLLKGVLWAVLG